MTEKLTTVNMYESDNSILDYLKIDIKRKIGIKLKKYELLRLMLKFIEYKKDEFFEFIKKELSKS